MQKTEISQAKDWLLPIENLPNVGPATKNSLQKLGIETIKDLLYHFPSRYLDTSKVSLIKDLRLNEVATVCGTVKKISRKIFGRRKSLVEVIIGDKSGYISALFFNQPFMAKIFEEGDCVALAGKVEFRYGRLQINNPLYDKLDKGQPLNTMKILPFHRLTQGISAKQMRMLIRKALAFIPKEDYLPPQVINSQRLVQHERAIKEIHFPENNKSLIQARKRLIFEEFFELQLAILIKKNLIGYQPTFSLQERGLIKKALKILPFELTGDQKIALEEILDDLSSKKPMNRLLQGEVGSGKTVVSFLSALRAIENSHQACMMAPTEILAQQHYQIIEPYSTKLGVKTALITSSINSSQKAQTLKEIASGKIDLVIGTHAIIQDRVAFKSLAFIVVDEQHRFGVEQRQALSEKGFSPHTLVMTATPIPRSLALTIYGDLDVGTIRELPTGKNFSEKVQTVVCGPKKRGQAYEKIKREVGKGRQAFIICPLIDPSDKIEAKAVEDEITHLKTDIFPQFKVESIHGKLKSEEKELIMQRFAQKKIDILVATTLIEVGIDIPNATVMLIENADRFGLAQLHQLRGRVGRGSEDAVCILFANLKTDDSIKRMKAIRELKDGFSLAEADLAIRGEGQIFGFKQAGLPDLKIASLTKDFEVLKKARKQAKELLWKDSQLNGFGALKKEVLDKYKKLLNA